MIHNPKLTASLIAASGVYGVELAEEVKFWDNKYGVLTKNVNGSALRKNCQQIKNMFDFIISLPWRWVPKCTNEYKEMIKKETWIS